MKDSLASKIFKSFKQLFSGQGVFTIAGFIAAYFFAKILGPEDYGTWQTAKIFTNYGTLFLLGLPFVMRRDFVQLRADGQVKEAEKMTAQVFAYSLVIQPFFSIALFIIAIYYSNDQAFAFALVTVGIMNLAQIISGYGDIVSKGLNRYDVLQKAKYVLSSFTLLTVLFVWQFGYYGLLGGLLLAQIALAVFYFVKCPIRMRWYWDFSLLKKMILIGLPLFIQTAAAIIFSSIDRLLIAAYLSFTEVGYYSLSAMIKSPLTLLISTLSIVVFTQLNEKFGKEKSNLVVKLHVELPQNFVTYCLSPLIVFGIILLPYVTVLLLPAYTPGINAAQVFAFAILFLSLAGFSSNALFILDKQKYAAVSFTLAGIIKIIGSLLLLRMGYGITAIAMVTLIAYLFYDMLMVYWVKSEIKESFNFKFILIKNLPVLYAIVCFFVCSVIADRMVSTEYSLEELMIQLTVFTIFMVPYYFIAKKKIEAILNQVKSL